MTTESPPRKTPFWMDALLLTAELTARNLYWRVPALRAWVKRRRRRSRPPARTVDRQKLRERLQEIGVREGALVMAHTGIAGLTLCDANGESETRAHNSLQTAAMLLEDLMGLLGAAGTLVMPTNPIYQSDERFFAYDETSPPIKYDPARTPCGVGLANEAFWRRPGVRRSLHPFNSLAAYGPLAADLLQDNLNEDKPLAHGIYSGYYRFCQHNGLVISVGVPLGASLTLVHAIEDVLDSQYPIKGFFRERRYLVRVNGVDQPWTVREGRPEYAMFCRCGRKGWRDLRGEGILHEGTVDGVRVDWAWSREVLDFFASRCKSGPYPHYCTWLAGKRQ